MLGQNYATNTWPSCGEIDIMEHKGNIPNKIYGTLHYPGNSGGNGNGNSTTISGASSQFHVYKAIWSPNSVKLYVDDVLFHTVINNGTLPFNADFFLILNVAMGGTFGGAIDPSFIQSSMEIDYVRVYQDKGNKNHTTGCSPPSHPTEKYIQYYQNRYKEKETDDIVMSPVQIGGGNCVIHSSCGKGKCVDGYCTCNAGYGAPLVYLP